MIKRVSFYLLFPLLLAACKDKPSARRAAERGIYADYTITGTEDNPVVTCLVQFYSDGSKRTSLLLEEDASVQLDGVPIPADSARFSGTFYELQQPAGRFPGKHTLTFTNNDGKTYSEEFSFVAFRLRTELPPKLPRKDLMLELEGLPPADVLRVVLTDTAFVSNGINRLDTVKNGQLLIREDDLAQLKAGPVVFHLVREEERKLGGGLPGRISLSYSLTRDFFLEQ